MVFCAYCPVCGYVRDATQKMLDEGLRCSSCDWKRKNKIRMQNSNLTSDDVKTLLGRTNVSPSEEEEFIRQKFVYGNPLYDPKKGQQRKESDERIYAKIYNTTKPHCPICGSAHVEKIGFMERGVSVATLGLLSKKIGKTYKCKNCGMTF